MRIGVVFPQTEMPSDAGAVRSYATAAGELGYMHLLVYDHVVGADPAVHTGWSGPYHIKSTFLEPMVLLGFLAGNAHLELATGIVILPQRQAVVVAKQAATLDVLCGGRLRLGVGIGWNPVEYEACGEDFHTRGRRIEEQIALMRRLWTESSVTFAGDYHQVTGAGIAPLPLQRPIPLWLGAHTARRALERVGRLADGWIPLMSPGAELDAAIGVVAQAARAAGRDPADLGLEGRMNIAHGNEERIASRAQAWRNAGATHLSLNTMGGGLQNVDDHISALRAAGDVLLRRD